MSHEQPVYNERYYEFNYGLLRRAFPFDTNSPSLRKPAFLAHRTLTDELAGLALQEVAANRQRPDTPNTYWYRFGRYPRSPASRLSSMCAKKARRAVVYYVCEHVFRCRS
ncbi:MAG: hypothetical protein ABIV47_28880, partial [Roseiflexaceae bacterium]